MSAKKKDEEGEDESLEAKAELADIFSGMGPGLTRIKLYRLDMGKTAWLATFPTPQGISEEMILRKYGAGDYALRGVDGSGKFLKGASRSITIGEVGNASEMPSVYQPPPPDTSSMDRIMEMIMLQGQRTHEMILAMITASGNNRQPSMDPAALLVAMVGAVGQLKAATDAPGNQIGQLKEMIELTNTIRGDGGESANENPLLTAALKIAPMLAGQVGQPPPQANPQPLPTLVVHVWERLMFKATHNGDPGLMADWMIETAQEPTQEAWECREILASVGQSIDFNSWFEKMEQMGRLAPMQAGNPELFWFQEWYTLCKGETIPDQPEETPTKEGNE